MSRIFLTISIFCASLGFAAPINFSDFEKQYQGRLGVFAVNTANQQTVIYRVDERFPFDSTFKVILVGAILKKSESDPTLLEKVIHYTQEDIQKSGYAPITAQHLKTGMTVHELCEAAIEYSDNTAGNLLIQELGGVQSVTGFARSLGDNSFELNRREPDLNENIKGDRRDTSTPRSMAESFQKMVLGNALAEKQRALLQAWLKANTTGKDRLRSAVPKNWIVGDKTGTGKTSMADIAVLWPPESSPWIVAIYFESENADQAPEKLIIAEAGRRVFSQLHLSL
jgi:beta-lactamase class A